MEPTPHVPPRPRVGPAITVALSVLVASAGASAPAWWAWRAEAERSRLVELLLAEQREVVKRWAEAVDEGREPWIVRSQLTSLMEPPDVAPGPLTVPAAAWALAISALAGVLAYWRWSKPLESIERALLESSDPPVTGPPILRSLGRAVVLAHARAKRSTGAEMTRWRRALEAVANGHGLEGLEPDVEAETRRVLALLEERKGVERASLVRIVAFHRDSRALARQLARRIQDATLAWTALREAVVRAESQLTKIGPEVEARRLKDHERARAVRDAARSLEQALMRAGQGAEDLAAQAARATDASARAAARQLRIASGGPVDEADPASLGQWAADLLETSRALYEASRSIRLPPAFPSARSEGEWEALGAIKDGAQASVAAVDATGPLLRALGRWARHHQDDVDAAWRTLLAGQNDSAAASDGTAASDDLATRIFELEAAARAAHQRLSQAIDRTERVLSLARS